MLKARPDSAETRRLLAEVAEGDRYALGRLLERYRARLRAFIEARLDPRVQARLDPSDVVQEVQMEVVRRMDDFLERRPMPFHLWIRKTAYERLLKVHRDHRRRARRARRTVDREVAWPDRSSLLVARPLLAGASSPSQHLAAQEVAERISRAVAELAETDREVLLMRHAEDLDYAEIAALLDITADNARQRYGRALLRLRKVLKEHGLLESSS